MAALGLTAPQTATAVAGSRPASGAKMVWSISYGRLALQCLAFVFAVGMFESADLSSSLTPMSAFHKKMWADGIALHAKLNGLTRPYSSTTTSIVLVHDQRHVFCDEVGSRVRGPGFRVRFICASPSRLERTRERLMLY